MCFIHGWGKIKVNVVDFFKVNEYVNITILGGGLKYFLFSSLFGEKIQFDEHTFQMGGSTTN